MFVFWLICALMALAATAVVIVPLVRGSAVNTTAKIAPERLAALRRSRFDADADLQQGLITSFEHQAKLLELTSNLAQDLANGRDAHTVKRLPFAVLAALACLPIAAFAIYLALGSPESVLMPATNNANGQIGPAEIRNMVKSLEVRLQKSPKDGNGWALLGRSKAALGDDPGAVKAYRQALVYLPQDVGILTDAAETLARTAGNPIEGEPSLLVERALQIAPSNPKALAMGGAAAMAAGNPLLAKQRWQALVDSLPSESPDKAAIAGMIQELQNAKLNAEVPATTNATKPLQIHGTVNIAASQTTATSATLFIFVKSAQSPMPLAALKISNPKLPLRFSIGDDERLRPDTPPLADAGPLLLSARLSLSGQATAQAGDIESAPSPIALGDISNKTSITLMLDRVHP